MLEKITLEKYKEEIELKLTNERYMVSTWVEELNKPSIIPPRKKPISKRKKKLLKEEEESESDSSGHSHTCECSECIPRVSFELTKSCTLPNNETEDELSETKSEELIVEETRIEKTTNEESKNNECSTNDTALEDFSLISYQHKEEFTLTSYGGIISGKDIFNY